MELLVQIFRELAKSVYEQKQSNKLNKMGGEGVWGGGEGSLEIIHVKHLERNGKQE